MPPCAFIRFGRVIYMVTHFVLAAYHQLFELSKDLDSKMDPDRATDPYVQKLSAVDVFLCDEQELYGVNCLCMILMDIARLPGRSERCDLFECFRGISASIQRRGYPCPPLRNLERSCSAQRLMHAPVVLRASVRGATCRRRTGLAICALEVWVLMHKLQREASRPAGRDVLDGTPQRQSESL